MTPTSLAPRPLYEAVAERLRERIVARELEPGSWIDEQKLAAEYGISRTPLREALKVLAAEGLVAMKVRRGAYVAEVSAADVAQVFHLLALIESDAAATVAARATPQQHAELQALHARLEQQAGQRDAFFAANDEFHLALLRIAGNRWAAQAATDLRKVMKLSRHRSLHKSGRIAASLAEHRALLRAIVDGRAEDARRLMQQHFAGGHEASAP
ncbi:MAG TPA: GntR family transcriptional regulator [Rubrivivax sp.]|nr:GntR family transcriptional regulator [Rubrivivax sp.]HRZ63230.1 GntR family transcriptional regulator [Rubrivivax sp.]